MQCLILAGGRGTRMSRFTDHMPKSLIPVLGVPFASHQLKWLQRCGITRVVYAIGYRGDLLQEYVGDGSAFGLEVAYVSDGPVPLGTGGPIRQAWQDGLLESWFFTLYGDSFLPHLDFRKVAAAYQAQSAPVMMTVLHNLNRWGTSNVALREGRLHYLKGSQSPDLEYIDYGVSAIAANLIDEFLPAGGATLEGFFRELSQRGMVAPFEVGERFYEIGSDQGLLDMEDYLSQFSEL